MAKKGLFTCTALERLNLYRCPWNTWFTLALSRCLGKTFRYKVQDREIVLSGLVVNLFQNQILKYLTHSINVQMESLHIEPLRGCGQSYQRQRLCCCGQSPGVHRCSFAYVWKRFRCGPCAVTRLQCWGSMAIPSPERTPVHAGVMIERTFVLVFLLPVFANSNFHIFNLMWI